MTETERREDDNNNEGSLLEVAQRQMARTLCELDRALAEIEARGEGAGAKARAAAADLRKAIQHVFDERQRIEKLNGTAAGGAGRDGLDLDTARAEIGRRLARLRDESAAEGVS